MDVGSVAMDVVGDASEVEVDIVVMALKCPGKWNCSGDVATVLDVMTLVV